LRLVGHVLVAYVFEHPLAKRRHDRTLDALGCAPSLRSEECGAKQDRSIARGRFK
jgi:hypothetical protein